MANRMDTPAERAALVRQSYARMRERMLRVRRLLKAADEKTAATARPVAAMPRKERG